jgi:threonine dehydratase
MDAPTLDEIRAAATLVRRTVPETPLHAYPLLAARAGCDVRVKHENHTPVGAFKIRGGLVYMDALKRRAPGVAGVCAATRGNHGQSVAVAAGRSGLAAIVVVPRGNSREKNAAMRAQGAELIEHGDDFNAALDFAKRLAAERGLHMVPSFHKALVQGVATYALEMFAAAPDLDAVYVPIGLGSGICAVMAARDALGAKAEVIGVVAENAPTYALSFAAKKPVSTNSADTIADGMAVRIPDAEAVDWINRRAARIVRVSEAAIRAAMRAYYTDAHTVAEGAGAAPLAALLAERDRMRGKKVALVLSGGNVDREMYARVLAEPDDVA